MKNVVILGDSYSTFKGYIPEGYGPWYGQVLPEANDVHAVEQTWWYLFREKSGCRLVRNDSWSGSTVCNTGYDGVDYSDHSFITRLDRLIAEDFFRKNDVDTLIVLGGTNDAWCGAPLGELIYDGEGKDLYSVLPAIGYMARRIHEGVPASVHTLIVINTEIGEEVPAALEAAAKTFEIDVLSLHDIDKMNGHPCQSGMIALCDQILDHLQK